MKKNYFKKSLSLIMTVLMLMSCWVFVAPTEAEAYAVVNPPVMNGNNAYTQSNGLNAYGTPIFDGNHDRWFKWANTSSGDWTTVYYPSHIYLDKTESLQAAGYNFYVEWHFGSNTNYRIILASPIWGDYYNRDGGYLNSSITPSAYPKYFTMTNIFSNYKIDASNPKDYPSGLYGTTGSVTDYDTRIVGYSDYKSSQGTDQYTYNDQYNDKLLFWRSNQSTNMATIYLMGNPSSSYVGTTTEYNTSGTSVGNYGLAQSYNKGWSTHTDGSAQFNSKGSTSSYMEGQWIEMQWFVTIYDKSALDSLITSAKNIVNNQSAQYTYASIQNLKATITKAENQLKVRAQTQTDIDNTKNALQSAIDALAVRTVDITFENMFSISDWYNSASSAYNTSNGEIVVEGNNCIKIYKNITGELTTSSSYSGNHNADMYSIPVTGGKAYTVRYETTSSANGDPKSAFYLFWFNVNGNPVNNTDGTDTFNTAAFSSDGVHSATFTAPDGATQAEIRFDNDCDNTGSTIRFKNIAVYPADRAAEIGLETWGNRPYTKAYTYNAALGTSLTVPTRAGYTFNGWYLDNNGSNANDDGDTIVTDGNGAVVSSLQSFGVNNHYNLKADWVPTEYTLTFDANGGKATTDSMAYDIIGTVTIPNVKKDNYAFNSWKVTVADGNWTLGDVYSINDRVTGKYGNATLQAQWTNLWTVTFLDGDGSVLGTAKVKNGDAATAPIETPTKASDADNSYDFSSWDTDFSNVTGNMTVTPVFTSKAHTVDYVFVSDRTCTKNAMVKKYCSGCGYSFFEEGEYDGTEKTEWLKLGHDFEGQPAVIGSSQDGTHEVRCSRYNSASCGGTKRVAHSFDKVVSTEGATCTVKGTVTKSCPCGETTQVEGETDPNGHNYDETKGTPNNDNATHIVACIYDPTHTKSVNCTDNDKNCICDICNQELVHSYVNKTKDNVVSEAECEKYAVYYLTCQCGKYSADTWTDTDSALEHNWTNTEKYIKIEANCTDDEVYYKECSLCGISSENKTGATWTKANTKWNHKFDGAYVTNNNGTHVQKCTNKDCTATGNQQGCDYGAWTTDNAVTHSHTCKFCGYTPAAENHDWTAWAPVDRTATTAGSMTRKCNVCGKTETKECTYDETHYDATCTTPERTENKCSDCGHGYTVIGEAETGHDFSGEVKSYGDGKHAFLCANKCGAYGVDKIVNAKTSCSYKYTNTAEGTHTAECTVCKYTYSGDCSGGQATCTAKAECQYCETAYGEKSDHSFNGAVKVLEGDEHAYLCEFCGTTTGIYGIGNTENKTEACSGGDATCSDLAECDICKDTYGALDADGHKWSTVAPDADNAGKHIYTCEYNNAHTMSGDCVSGSSKVVAPTCTDKGYTIQTCKECSYEWKTDFVDETDHNWVDPVCNNNGTHTLTCNNENADGWACDKTLTLNCAESAITYGLESATCTEQGYTTYQCTVCNYTWNADFVSATGHSYEKELRSLDATYKRSEKTCTEAETYWYRCDNCTVSAGTEEDKYADKLASIYWSNGKAAGHNWIEVADEAYINTPATCTAKAKYYKSCSVCKISSEDTAEEAIFSSGVALDHDYQNIVDEDDLTKNRVSEATCTSPAIYYKSCVREGCGVVSKETFEYGKKIGHKMTKTDANEATCEEAGNVEYYTCSNCNVKFSDEEGTTTISKTTIPALDHDWVVVSYKAPSCEEAGHSEYEDCSRCDKIRNKEDYEATGHKFTGAYYCDTVNGYHSRYCVNANCLADGEKATGIGTGKDAVKYSVEFDGLDYVIKGGEKCEFTSSDTLTDENGIHSHKLSCVCGNETSKAYTDEETFVETVAATCTADGYDSYKCNDCGATWKKNIVATSGHDLAEKATSNGDGTHSVKCSKCDYTSDAEYCSGGTATCKDKAVCAVCNTAYGETTDHTYDDTKWVYQNDATCTEDGTEKNSCTVCQTETTRTAEDTADGHSMIADYVYTTEGWTKKPTDFAEDIKAPNCKDEGLGIMYCTKCDYYKTRTAKADSNSHIWATDDNGEEIWTVLGGNCASGVTSYKTCTVCGDREIKTTAAPHTWKVVAVKEATCVENGYVDLRCDVCNFTASLKGETADDYVLDEVNYADIYDVIATGSHTWQTEEPADEDYMVIDDVVVFVEKYPAYNANGRGYKKCALCGAIEEITIPAYGNDPADHKHPEIGINDNSTLKYVKEVDSTCTAGGHKGYYECTRCSYSQYVLDHDAYYIAAKGHTEPNADGKCDRCKTTLEEDTNSRNCGCICHKDSGFMKFIYKILRFFWKLFGMNKTCACGAAHY